MRPPTARLVAGPLLVLAFGCPGEKDDTAAPSITCEEGTTITLSDENNYSFTGTLDIATVDVQAYTTEAPVDYTIDWSASTVDLQGHALDPAADIDMVTVVAFPHLSEDEVEAKLADNTLLQSDIGGYAFTNVDGVTSVQLSELTLLGNDIDIESYLTEGSATWMILLASGSTPGVGSRILHFVEPVSTSTNTTIAFDDASTVLNFDVDLAHLTPVGVPAATPGLTLDWSAITLDGRGGPLDTSDVDTIKLAWFADGSFTDLESTFLDVELDADQLWTLDVTGGTTADLTGLTGGAPWSGIDDTGVWALALACSTCSNPAPLHFTQLVACP